MQTSRLSSCTALLAGLLCTLSLSLIGCTGAVVSTPLTSQALVVSGNWQFASSAPAAAKLPAFSGALNGTSANLTGVLHADGSNACIAPATAIAVTGSTSAQGLTTLTSSNFPGGTLTLSGTLAADGKSMSGVSYNVAGGACAFATPAAGTANAFSPITGNFTGSFSDASGSMISVTASLSQSPASDPNGNFTLSGTGTFPSNPCFNSPVSVSNTQVTGGSFTLTYADPATTNSVTASGTFSQDGSTLTVTNWTLSGPCGPDSGTGALTRH